MSNQQRLAVFATRMSLNNMKIKQKGAAKGHSLLKRKSDALTARFRQILQRIRDAKMAIGELMKEAAFSLAEVNYAAGDISFTVRESVTATAPFKVTSRLENVSGVQLPIFESVAENGNALDLTCLGRGGQQVQKSKEAYTKALGTLIELASLQTAFHILDNVIQVTNRRVNALEYVVLPRVENTIAYITAELDEQDREEFFRLKKIQSKKKREQDALELERALNESAQRQAGQQKYRDDAADQQYSKNMLAHEDDADVIF